MEEASLEEELLQAIINEPVPLAEEQIKVVTAKERYIKVVAGAGTGKTETLIRRLLYLLLCEDVPPEGIVAFTFTEKAAQEMRVRIHARIRDLGLDGKIPGLGNMYIGTIHSYCLHLLCGEFGYSNFNVLDENQEVAFVLRVGRELGFEDRKISALVKGARRAGKHKNGKLVFPATRWVIQDSAQKERPLGWLAVKSVNYGE
ncbi:MAG: UvrD-helicase domain-containing protein [Candidatus Atribacteria bacterium]|nr:UvrD-helicase domain-containing protein [Candidatus Atribacteria bacterium]MCD6350146.1 UvrD-helicase domain-containing protein [Candidatus Atribacteria bacterium]